MLRDAYRLDVQIDPDDAEVSNRSMNGGKLSEAIGYRCDPWPVLVYQLAEDDTPYREWLGQK
jgi:hypothetical protein